jgi:hypothetical protein
MSFRDALTRLVCPSLVISLSKSAKADLDGAGPKSILPMAAMDSGLATLSRPGMTVGFIGINNLRI